MPDAARTSLARSPVDWGRLSSALDATPQTRCLGVALSESFKIGSRASFADPIPVSNTEDYWRAIAFGHVAAGLARAGYIPEARELNAEIRTFVENRMAAGRTRFTKPNLLHALGVSLGNAVESGDEEGIQHALRLAARIAPMPGGGGYELIHPIQALLARDREHDAELLLRAAGLTIQAEILASLYLAPDRSGAALVAESKTAGLVSRNLKRIETGLPEEEQTAKALARAVGAEISARSGAPRSGDEKLELMQMPEFAGWALGAQAAGFFALKMPREDREYLAETPVERLQKYLARNQFDTYQDSAAWRQFSLALMRGGSSEALSFCARSLRHVEGLEGAMLNGFAAAEYFILVGDSKGLRSRLQAAMSSLTPSDRAALCAEVCCYAVSRPGNFDRRVLAETAVRTAYDGARDFDTPADIVGKIVRPLSELGLCEIAGSILGLPARYGMLDFEHGARVARHLAKTGDVVAAYELLQSIDGEAERYLIQRQDSHIRAVDAAIERRRAQDKKRVKPPPDLPGLDPGIDSMPELSEDRHRELLLRTWKHDAERVRLLAPIAETFAAIGCPSEAHEIFTGLAASAAASEDPRSHLTLAKHAARSNGPIRDEYFDWRRFRAFETRQGA